MVSAMTTSNALVFGTVFGFTEVLRGFFAPGYFWGPQPRGCRVGAGPVQCPPWVPLPETSPATWRLATLGWSSPPEERAGNGLNPLVSEVRVYGSTPGRVSAPEPRPGKGDSRLAIVGDTESYHRSP